MSVDYSIEDEAAAPEPETKRGPGRPRGSTNKAKPGAPPRPPKSPGESARKTARPAPRAWVREQCATFVAYANLGFLMLAAPKYKPDVLTDAEMSTLTDALVLECEGSQRIMSWLGRAAGISPHVALISALAKIALPRLQRHGVIPGGEHDGEYVQPSFPGAFSESFAGESEQWESMVNAARNGSESAPTPAV